METNDHGKDVNTNLESVVRVKWEREGRQLNGRACASPRAEGCPSEPSNATHLNHNVGSLYDVQSASWIAFKTLHNEWARAEMDST